MGRLETFRKYIIWIILFYLFTMLMTYIGFNSSYKNIESDVEIPSQTKIDIAQSTKVNGRIFGEVTSTEENDLNGKYIKVQIFNRRDALVGTKYLKIEDAKINEPKKFVVYFTAENVEKYKIEILEDSEELQKDIKSVSEMFKDVFTDKELSKSLIWAFVLWAIFY